MADLRRHSARSARPTYRGGATTFLYEHRAFARLPRPARTLAEAVVLTLVTTAAWLALLPVVGRAWGYALVALAPEGVGVVMTLYEVAGATVGVPHLALEASLPGAGVWSGAALGTGLLFAASFALPDRMTPGIYALRAVCLIQASAVLYFAFWADRFPYTLGDYLRAMMATGLVIATVTPVVLGFIWHIQDVAWPKKLALVVLMQGYAVVLIPLQYATHGLVLREATLLFLPVLYILFGVLLHTLTLIALYAWGMSWSGELPALGVPAVPLADPASTQAT